MPSAPTSFEALRATLQSAPTPDMGAIAAAEARNDTLTKPPGALGRLEEIAIWLGGWQGKAVPTLDNVQVLIFAGNHGVTAQGVSAFPAEVTAQMVMNFEHGGAAINQLSNAFGAKFEVHALDLETPTGDFTQTEAMSEADCLGAIAAGWNALDTSADVMLTGEMGIGNTTSAAAIACALYGGDPTPGSGAVRALMMRGCSARRMWSQEVSRAILPRHRIQFQRFAVWVDVRSLPCLVQWPTPVLPVFRCLLMALLPRLQQPFFMLWVTGCWIMRLRRINRMKLRIKLCWTGWAKHRCSIWVCVLGKAPVPPWRWVS